MLASIAVLLAHWSALRLYFLVGQVGPQILMHKVLNAAHDIKTDVTMDQGRGDLVGSWLAGRGLTLVPSIQLHFMLGLHASAYPAQSQGASH